MRIVRGVLAATLTALLAASAAGPARGADLATELGELATAVGARIAAADGTKEAKRLEKARKTLESVDPATAGAPEVGAVLKAVFGAKSVDPTLVDEATDVLLCLQSLVESEKAAAEEALDDLLGSYLAKFEKRLAGADSKLAEGAALVSSDPKKAALALASAYGKYVKSGKYAVKALELQQRFGTCGALGNSTGMWATVTGPGGFRRKFSGFASGEDVFGQLGVGGCRTGRGTSTCTTALFLNLSYPSGSRTRGQVPANLVRYTESSDFDGGGIQDLNWAAFSGFYAEVSESTAGMIKGCFRGTLVGETVRDTDPQTLTVEGTFVIRRPK